MKAVRAGLVYGWNSLKRGKDVELYLMLVVALTLILLHALHIVSPEAIGAGALGVLILLAVALLKNRFQSEQLQLLLIEMQRPETPLAERFFTKKDRIEEISSLIPNVTEEVCLWGTTLSMHIPYLAPAFKKSAELGRTVKLLLIKPGSASIAMSALRAGPKVSSEDIERGLEHNLEILRPLVEASNGRLQVRLVDYLAPYTLYAYDPETSSGRMDLRLGSFHGDHELRPTFQLLRERDGEWYFYFLAQFKSVWTIAEPLDSETIRL